MNNCEKAPKSEELTSNTMLNKKPIVISAQRYENITKQAKQEDKIDMLRKADDEQKYKEYLKEGSDALVAKFTTNMPRTKKEKMDELQAKMEKKDEQVKLSYAKSKEKAETQRRVKNLNAQQQLEKAKSGPNDLESAAMQSEVLRGRNMQIKIQQAFKCAIKKQDCVDHIKCDEISKWEKEKEENVVESQKRSTNYKNDLLKTIKNNAKYRAELKKQLLQEQLEEREANEIEIKAQIEKERLAMEQKRAVLRQNALEAMKMVEQRRMRDTMTNEIEDRINCVYNVAKRQLDGIRNIQKKEQLAEGIKARALNAAYIGELQKRALANEEDRIARDIAKMELKFTNEEKEKIRKNKAAKRSRIEAYLHEMHQMKLAKSRADEEKRFEMALRFKNTEVNCLFNEAEKQERLQKVLEVRQTLKRQIDEHKRAADEMKPSFDEDTDKYDKEDNYFFEYALDLMEDANKKQRPLYPFIKMVNQYKRSNQIDCERKTPRHLQSHLNIGCRQRGDSKAVKSAADAKAQAKCSKPELSAREAAIENCRKINELIANEGGGDLQLCAPHCSVECMEKGKPRSVDIDYKSQSPKMRYSTSDLKKLQFTVLAPISGAFSTE